MQASKRLCRVKAADHTWKINLGDLPQVEAEDQGADTQKLHRKINRLDLVLEMTDLKLSLNIQKVEEQPTRTLQQRSKRCWPEIQRTYSKLDYVNPLAVESEDARVRSSWCSKDLRGNGEFRRPR